MPKGIYERTVEHKKNMSEAMKGKKHSKETKKKMSKSHIGLNIWTKGKSRSDETKRKISKGHKGKVLSVETKKKMSEARIELGKNKIVSKETRMKVSDSLAGKMPKNTYCFIKNKYMPYGNVKRGYYNINNKKMFFRSKWEANVALYLDFLVRQEQIKSWSYEKDVFIFDKINFGIRSYRPDFKIININNSYEYWEVKGFINAGDKTKLKRFRKYYPKEFSKLWFVIENPFAKSKANGEMVTFFLDVLEMSFDKLMSYKEIQNKLIKEIIE